MFTRLLVPLDGTPRSEAALPLAATLARSVRAELKLVRVIEDDADAALVDQASRRLATAAARLEDGELNVQTDLLRGDVAASILDEAGRPGVDLVVMATAGRPGLTGTALGTVTAQVLDRSPVPVLALRASTRSARQVKALLVPVDGSRGSEAGIVAARPLAKAAAAHIVLLHVIPARRRSGRDHSLDRSDEELAYARAQDYVDGLAAQVRQGGVGAEARVGVGWVAPTILRVATDVGADLIVMSTRAATSPAGYVLGSVTDEVLRQASQPVVLVRQVDWSEQADSPRAATASTS